MNKNQLESLLDSGKSMCDIAKETGKSLTSIRHWCKKYNLKSQYGSFKMGGEKAKKSTLKSPLTQNNGDESHLDYSNWSEDQKKAYSYLLGFYLGDGCLQHDVKRNNRSYTILISNQYSYTRMNNEITTALNILFPNKEVKFYKWKNSDCLNIKLTAINLHLLFPHGRGAKHTRKIELTIWQNEIIDQYPKEFIKGMIESDGCRFAPRKKQCPTYFIYQFSNASLDLHGILHRVFKNNNVEFTIRQIKAKKLVNPQYWTCINKRESFNFLDSFIGPKN